MQIDSHNLLEEGSFNSSNLLGINQTKPSQNDFFDHYFEQAVNSQHLKRDIKNGYLKQAIGKFEGHRAYSAMLSLDSSVLSKKNKPLDLPFAITNQTDVELSQFDIIKQEDSFDRSRGQVEYTERNGKQDNPINQPTQETESNNETKQQLDKASDNKTNEFRSDSIERDSIWSQLDKQLAKKSSKQLTTDKPKIVNTAEQVRDNKVPMHELVDDENMSVQTARIAKMERQNLDGQELKKELEKHGIISHQNHQKNTVDTEGMVRVALESEKWSVHRTHVNSTTKDFGEPGQSRDSLFASSNKQGQQTKSFFQNQKNQQDGQRNGTENSANHHTANLSSLFSLKENQEGIRATNRFAQDLHKENLIKENRRLYNELVQKAKVNLNGNGSSNASIRMRPHALGRMTLNLEIFQNQVQAQIIVESKAAKQMLTEEMNYLQQELQRQGVKVESLSIQVKDSFAEQMSDDNASKHRGTNSDDGQKKSTNNESDQSFYEQEDKQLYDKEQRKEMALVLPISADEYETSQLLDSLVFENKKGIDVHA